MTGKYFESDYEEAFIDLLQQEGWEYSYGEEIHRPFTEPLLLEDLEAFFDSKYQDDQYLSAEDMALIEAKLENISGTTDYAANRNAYLLYTCGFDYHYADGRPTTHLSLIDFEHPERNIFRCVNQFEYHQGDENRRPDIMLFVNGIPVGIIELKNPTDENATISDAHDQITIRYRRDIPSLLKYCSLAVISDGSNSRLGTIFSPFEYFYAWKKVENDDNPAKALDQLRTLVKGALSPSRLCEILRDFVYYPDTNDKEDKELEIVCRYPQFFATRKLRDHILQHLHSRGGDGKGGHYFGATGCGKTYTMLFLARQLKLRCLNKVDNPTILLIVDREDLEDQSTKLFVNSKTYLADNNIKSFESREELEKELRALKGGGMYITTIQKFTSSTGLLSDRSNIICFSDEAHRTQDNIGSHLKVNADEKKGEVGAFITYGFAKYLRDALPRATYVGFTGTPIDEVVHVFGAEVDRYTMKQSVDDGITVPIYYEGRMAKANLDPEKVKKIEDYYAKCADEGSTQEEIEKSKKAMSSLEIIIGDKTRLERVAKDIVGHWEKRLFDQPEQLQKAMIVCANRKIAFTVYNIIAQLRPEWVEPKRAMDESKYTEKELKQLDPVAYINLVGTQGANDQKEMYDAFGDKDHRKWLDKQFKNERSNFHIAIVVDMWITGYDCPSLTVMYNDKPLQKHTLIQTISRVNRKSPGKDYGLIVDYLGIRENMKRALKMYGNEQESNEDEIENTYKVLKNEISILCEFFHGFDFTPFLDPKCQPLIRLQCLQSAVEFVLSLTKNDKKDPEPKTVFLAHVRRLKKAFEICNPAGVLTEEDIAYSQTFMAISSYLRKISDSQKSAAQMNRDVEKMVEEALRFNNVETILHINSEEDIFGDAFMHELDDVKMPNTKFQILVKMLKRAIKDYAKTNKVKAEHFALMLQQVVDEYNDRKIEQVNKTVNGTLDEINGMIHKKVDDLTEKLKNIFKELKTDRQAFKKLGITFEEKAFYDILVDIRDRQKFEYPDEKCKKLASEIKKLIDNNDFYADWLNNYNIKAQLKNDIIKTLYLNGFPPQWDKEVYDRVLSQVENYKEYHKENRYKPNQEEDDSYAMAAEPGPTEK